MKGEEDPSEWDSLENDTGSGEVQGLGTDT